MVKNGSVFPPGGVSFIFTLTRVNRTGLWHPNPHNPFSGYPLMAGFIGKELHALDDKGRLMIPVRFRRDLFSGNDQAASGAPAPGIYLYLMKVPDGSLELYEPDVWQRMKQALAGLSDFNPDERLLKTLIYESLDVVAVDRQGRIALSREFLEHAGITKDVVIVGADSKMIIWEPGRLSALLREHAERFSALAGKYF